MPSKPTALPPREANLFKTVVRLYETKQLKKAIKSADSILKKFPDHGETLAMKGLALNALDRKEEAHELVKRGLKLDLRSHICWHVYGLLYRSDRDYREAAKAYLNALRFDEDNQQILRDLSLLQIQIRDYEGLEETRRKLLTIRPNQKNNWIGFAVSFHLLGNNTTAISVLDTYQDTLKGSVESEDPFEVSELLLYKNLMLEESGDFAGALSHLEQIESRVVDRLNLREARARLLSRLGRHEECAAVLRQLIAVNPDNVAYHRGIQCTAVLAARVARGAEAVDDVNAAEREVPSMAQFRKCLSVDVQLRDKADVDAALKACEQLTAQYPRSRTSSRMALDIISSGDHPLFVPHCDAYVRSFLRRGVPSLFSDLKTLYVDESKATALGRLFESYLESVEGEASALPPLLPIPANPITEGDSSKTNSDSAPTGSSEKEQEAECTFLWILHYLAQHYDRIGLHKKALEYIGRAIEMSPKTIECYLVKARILKHRGDVVSAVKVADEVRNLDLADRYLNTKCTKYSLRANNVSQAEASISLFTRDGDSGGPQALYDMQCIWFELEAAESHLRCGQLSRALKKFTAVDRHFADMVEDQFDFHSYCLRKVTLRSYVNLLRYEDRIREHQYYGRAAVGMVKCLLRIADMPEETKYAFSGEHGDIEGYAAMSQQERKKAISKKKKRQARQKNQGSQPGSSSTQVKPKKSTTQADARSKTKGKSKAKAKAKANGTQSEANGVSAGSNQNTNASSSSSEKPKSNPGWMETDPDGSGLIRSLLDKKDATNKGPVESCVRFIREMEMHLGDLIETHYLAFEVAIRRKRYLQALRSVLRAQAIDKEDARSFLIALRLACEMDGNNGRASLSNIGRSVFEKEGDVLGGLSVAAYLDAYASRHQNSAKGRVGVAFARLYLTMLSGADLGPVDKACDGLVKAIESTDMEGCGPNAFSAVECKTLIEELKATALESGLLSKVLSACQRKHESATCFVVSNNNRSLD